MIRKTVTAAALAAALLITPATTASAATSTVGERNYLAYLRNPNSTVDPAVRLYTNTTLLNAGRYACARKHHYGLDLQFGVTRKRIVQAIVRDTNTAKFRGARYGLAVDVVDGTGWKGGGGGIIQSMC